MTSIRHGLRVLQNLDVSQHDWHADQILGRLQSLPPSGSDADIEVQAQAIFIDFSNTVQVTDLKHEYTTDDYGKCLSYAVTILNQEWVFNYWSRDDMKREEWVFSLSIPVSSGNSRGRILTDSCMKKMDRYGEFKDINALRKCEYSMLM